MESIKYVGGKGLKLNLMYLECWNSPDVLRREVE